MTKQEAKSQIAKLIEKYKNLVKTKKVKSFNEAQTRNELIEPLFEFLGWDMRNLENQGEVTTEENVSKGRVDLAFRLNHIPVMFLEAKALRVDLDEWKWAEQAINYSWNKSVTWAILTDFEGIKVFNAEIPPKSLSQNLFFELKWHEYLDRFEQLWLLSKESLEEKRLAEEAEKWGKLTRRKQVGEKLFEDLTNWRAKLTKDFKKNNNVDEDALDEGVQKVLDRLIFIRTAEDRKIEPNILLSILREWETAGKKRSIYKKLTDTFKRFDDDYNSKLFASHALEEWQASDKIIEEIIKGLYQTADGYRYDFSAISTDVLGGIYEQYLGYVQEKAQKDDKSKKSKRKSQGIYYTPKYIVEYLMEQTLGEVLKKAKKKDLPNIKILDPACGSGSFLISAYDKMMEARNELEKQTGLFDKFEILKNNIYGVDLDEQAIEIAQLNLLLRVLSQKTKLPTLSHNIRMGNSLVDGNMEKLELYFENAWREQKAFNWKQEFSEVFDQEGFSVIIGNPPYVVLGSDHSSLEYFKKNYAVSHGGKVNLYKLFLERAIKLLKPNGYLGFICPSNYLSSKDSEKLRKLLLKNTLIEIIEYVESDRVFTGVTQALTTIVVKKQISRKNSSVNLRTKKFGKQRVLQSDFSKNENLAFIPWDNVIKRMRSKSKTFGNIIEGYQGEINVSTKKDYFISKKQKDYLPLYRGNQIGRYVILENPAEWSPISIDKRGHYSKDRIVFQEVSNQQQTRRIKAVIIDKNNFCGHTTNYCFTKNSENNFYVLGLLNSNPVNYYFKYFNNTNHVPIGEIKNIPIPEANEKQQAEIAKLAQLMLDLRKELQQATENTDKYARLKMEIEKLDGKIDQIIYRLYELTDEEIATIEK